MSARSFGRECWFAVGSAVLAALFASQNVISLMFTPEILRRSCEDIVRPLFLTLPCYSSVRSVWPFGRGCEVLKSASSIRTNLSSEIKIITLLMAGFLHSIMLSKSAYSVTQLEFKPHLAYWILVAPSSGQGQSDGAELAPRITIWSCRRP